MFFYDGNVLHLGQFKSLKYIESDLIIVEFDRYNLNIIGDCLKIIQLTEDELYLQGLLSGIELKYDK